jgi:Leucine-rich repeat (LRR) protein
MKIKVRPHESVVHDARSTGQSSLVLLADDQATEHPGALVNSFLRALNLDTFLWRLEQECEISEDHPVYIGLRRSVKGEGVSDVWIWRVESEDGTDLLYIGDKLIALCLSAQSSDITVPVETAFMVCKTLNFKLLASLKKMSNLPALSVLGFQSGMDASVFSGLPNLRWLELYRCPLGDVYELSGLTDLTSLNLKKSSLRDISVLSGLRSLTSLNLDDSMSLSDISALSGLRNLTSLSLAWCSSLSDISALSGLRNLTGLNLEWCSSLSDISALSGLRNLTSLSLASCNSLSDISALSGLRNLTSLSLASCNSLSDIFALSGLRNLTSLSLASCNSLSDISALSGLRNLTSLDLEYCKSLSDISALSGPRNLTSLNLARCRSLGDVLVLSGLTALNSLSLRDCKTLTTLSVLSGLTNLTRLDLSACDQIRNLTPLSNLRSLESLRFTSRRVQSIECLREIPALRSLKEFNPPEVAEVLAHAAVLRSDRAHILSHAKEWLEEAAGWKDGSLALRERFAATLGEAFSLLGEHEIEIPYEEYLQGHPEYSSAPWKAWLAGTRSESGLALMRRRIERQVIPASTPGCIGGICAVLAAESEALEEVEWSKAWLNQMEEHWKERSKDLLPVSAEVCLAYARLGEGEALARWLKRFTDPSDLGVLDPVQVALANFQMTRGDFVAAQAHILAVQSSQMRDPLLRGLVEAIGASDPLQASLFLLLIEDPAARAQLAIRMGLKKEFASNETVLHRLIVSLDADPSALAELISNLPADPANPLVQKISEGLQTERKKLYQKIAAELESLVVRYKAKSVE